VTYDELAALHADISRGYRRMSALDAKGRLLKVLIGQDSALDEQRKDLQVGLEMMLKQAGASGLVLPAESAGLVSVP
jgi:hypothetical protein